MGPSEAPFLYLLGTGATVSDPHRTTTMLALEGRDSVVVIDCGGDVVQRLVACDVEPSKIDALIVTHEHADHVSGFPLMMERLWLYGRRRPLDVYGIAPAIEQARRVHDAFNTSSWPEYPEICYHQVAHAANAPVLESAEWGVTASPSRHSVPSVALRFADKRGGRVLAYSCDTEYAESVVALARGADLLVHEATGSGPGHSSALEAAGVAKEAGVGRMLLVHLPPEAYLDETAMREACTVFGKLEKGRESGRYQL